MIFLYNLGISFLRIAFKLAAPFHSKASAFVTGRKDIIAKINTAVAGNTAPLIWVHCASLGEFEQGRPIIESFKKEFADHKILLTFFSPSGYEVRKNYPLADYVFYLPWDTSSNAKRFVEMTKPVMALFVKYEFWLNYSMELKRRNIPLLSVSAIFRTDQLFFQSYGGFYRTILKQFTYFFVQNDESVKLLKSIGITNCQLAGDTRFDRVHEIVKQAEEIPLAKTFKSDSMVFVVGSCWPEDLDVLAPFINESRMKFIIAPHEISEASLAYTEKMLQVKSIRYSLAAGNTALSDYEVLIIDNMGMLSRLYRYGEFAYIGGAFGKGLHNILEAACYGVPIFFGNKNFAKFAEAVDLINRGGAFEIADYTDLKMKYELLNVPESFQLACEVTKLYVEENLGATEKIMKYSRKLLTVKK
ncbi:MAG: 3-deoxy-D-manno-octulosonic acid transferase [Azospira oryzae]|nr:MAG: 3-deoxy-D-manno-octulosonic acid transferase [Azospira oryzae]